MTRRTQVFLVILFAVLGLVALASHGSLPGAEPTAIEQLQQRIEKLEARVVTLEKQQKPSPELRWHLPHDSNAFAPDERSLRGQRVPENWRREEFNGEPYYIVPLDTPSAGR